MKKLAFVFPGQGSQYVGMGKDLSEKFEVGRKLFDEAGERLGFDLKKLCFEGPPEEIKKTAITQPAVFTVSAIAFEALKQTRILPSVLAGHSLGEYSALYAAGSIKFSDAIKLVHLRGKFMQEAVPEGKGTMAAILGLTNEKIKELSEKASSSGLVQAANINSPGQVVISGEKKAVEECIKLCKEAGAKGAIPLQVSAPFHSGLMKPAAERLKEELYKTEIKDAQIPIVSNVTASYVTNAEEIKTLLIKQVTSPVLWENSVKNIILKGITSFIEVGPGKVLAGLIKKIDKNVIVYNVEDPGSLEEVSKEVL